MLACSDPQRDRNGQRSLEARLPEGSLTQIMPTRSEQFNINNFPGKTTTHMPGLSNAGTSPRKHTGTGGAGEHRGFISWNKAMELD